MNNSKAFIYAYDRNDELKCLSMFGFTLKRSQSVNKALENANYIIGYIAKPTNIYFW